MFTQLKVTIAGAILLVVVVIAGLIYWRGSSNATTKNDLRVARETIKVEREALKVTSQIDLRVNAESIQTANTAQEATREIEAIRYSEAARARTSGGHGGLSGSDSKVVLSGLGGSSDRAGGSPTLVTVCDDGCTRVLQLAREARAAAVASSARLQPADAGARQR